MTHTGSSAKMRKPNLYRVAWCRDRYGTNTPFVIYYHLYNHNLRRDLSAAQEITKELDFQLETFAATYIRWRKTWLRSAMCFLGTTKLWKTCF